MERYIETVLASTRTQIGLGIVWSVHKMEFDGDVMASGRAGANDRSDFHIVARACGKNTIILCTLYHTINCPPELTTGREGFNMPEARLQATSFAPSLLADVDHACQGIAQQYMSRRGFNPQSLEHEGGISAIVNEDAHSDTTCADCVGNDGEAEADYGTS
jgi:hypothetical protein